MATLEIDEVDKKILSLLSQNPEISQNEVSETLKISQPAVNGRIRKLKEKGVLSYLVGIDIKKAELFLAKIDIATTDVENILNFFNNCPLYINSFLISGRYNLTVFLIGENIRSLMSCHTHFRQNMIITEHAKDMEFSIVVTPIRNFIVPITRVFDKKNTSPCKADCSHCSFYIENRCLGCPATIHYKGKVL